MRAQPERRKCNMSNLLWISPSTIEKAVQDCLCPYCEKTIAGNIRNVIGRKEFYPTVGSYFDDAFYILECPACQKPIIYDCKTKITSPTGTTLQKISSLPAPINQVYQEIQKDISVGSFTSAVMLARTALMHIAIEKGAEQGKGFAYYTDYFVSKGYVPPNAKDWIDRIRQLGNKAVHELEIWGAEEANMIGKFLMYLLIYIYYLPSSV